MDASIVSVASLNQIKFGERYRIDYGDIKELSNSIQERGLIQPLAVKRQNDPKEPYLLLGGGRRYMAMLEAGIMDCPIRIYPEDIGEFEIRSIELAENLYRKALEWQEEVALKRTIHDLYVAKYGEKVSTAPDAPGWSIGDTAALVGMDRTSVSKDLKLADALKLAPAIFEGCKSKSDASKVLKKVTEQALVEEMQKRAVKLPANNAKKSLMDCYILEDVFKGLATLEPGLINFVELDPPYGIGLDKIKRTDSAGGATATADYNEVSPDCYPAFMQKVLTECYRVMAPHSWMVVWFAPEPWFEPMYNWITAAGFRTKRMCGIWPKTYGQTMQPATSLANCYEMFYICRKGDPVLAKQGRSNVFDYPAVSEQKKIHPTERPVALIQEILNTFATPGARVLVPFLGSGATLIAAHNSGMTGLGFEITREYKDRYILRVNSMEG